MSDVDWAKAKAEVEAERQAEAEKLNQLLQSLVGKTVANVRHDYGYCSVAVDFTDGTTLDINAVGCEDFTVEVYGGQ